MARSPGDGVGKDFVTDQLAFYVRKDGLTATLNAYVLKDNLTATLNDYVRKDSLETSLNGYVLKTSFNTSLGLVNDEITTLKAAVQVLEDAPAGTVNLSGYYTKQEVTQLLLGKTDTSALSGLATTTALTDAISTFNSQLLNKADSLAVSGGFTQLQQLIGNKADTSHGHASGEISGLSDLLAAVSIPAPVTATANISAQNNQHIDANSENGSFTITVPVGVQSFTFYSGLFAETNNITIIFDAGFEDVEGGQLLVDVNDYSTRFRMIGGVMREDK